MKNSKIILTTIISLLTLATNAQAENTSGLYIGVDALRSFVSHKYLAENIPDADVGVNGYSTHKENSGFGINTGYNIAIGRSFIAPEIFYEHLNNSAREFGYEEYPQIAGNRLKVDNRYGAKINLGYNLFAGLNIFANAGLANVKYSEGLYSIGRGQSKTATFVAVYGGGLSYNLSKHWQIKASYDWQQFNARYDYAFEKDRILIQTVKFGVAYKF
jgi:opacity protein-like surface antigen